MIDKSVEVERRGLGTPATRAGVIENLIYKGFVERDKKNLLATHKGINLITIVAEKFKSAETTAKWEMELTEIAQGVESFIEIHLLVDSIVSNHQADSNTSKVESRVTFFSVFYSKNLCSTCPNKDTLIFE